MNDKGNAPRRDYERAVALSYREDKDSAPRLSAKGEREVAKQIIELAKENGVPIKEDPDLVGMLYKIDFDEEIPEELYSVVAELLAFVYKMNTAAGGDSRN